MMDSFHIHEDKLDDAFMVSTNIPEFDDPYEISEYSKRLNGTAHQILTAYDDHKPIAFKIGYQRHPDGSFYSWMGGVLPNYRRKGIATALKHTGLTWAKNQGYEWIRTDNVATNEGMLSINIRVGFKFMPAWLMFDKLLNEKK